MRWVVMIQGVKWMVRSLGISGFRDTVMVPTLNAMREELVSDVELASELESYSETTEIEGIVGSAMGLCIK